MNEGVAMSRDELIGAWLQQPGGHGTRLETDGSATSINALTGVSGSGTWAVLDERSFLTSIRMPADPNSGHNPSGYDEVTVWVIVEERPGRMVLDSREHVGMFEYERVEWLRADHDA
jgi:hypothetical protein